MEHLPKSQAKEEENNNKKSMMAFHWSELRLIQRFYGTVEGSCGSLGNSIDLA